MECKKCGRYIGMDVKFCPECGAKVGSSKKEDKEKVVIDNDPPKEADSNQSGVDSGDDRFAQLVSFFLPLFGIIIYVLGKEEFPRRSQKVLKSSLAGIIFYLLFGIILSILSIIAFIFFQNSIWNWIFAH